MAVFVKIGDEMLNANTIRSIVCTESENYRVEKREETLLDLGLGLLGLAWDDGTVRIPYKVYNIIVEFKNRQLGRRVYEFSTAVERDNVKKELEDALTSRHRMNHSKPKYWKNR